VVTNLDQKSMTKIVLVFNKTIQILFMMLVKMMIRKYLKTFLISNGVSSSSSSSQQPVVQMFSSWRKSDLRKPDAIKRPDLVKYKKCRIIMTCQLFLLKILGRKRNILKRKVSYKRFYMRQILNTFWGFFAHLS
jgi:hypothetical protein